MDKHEVLKKYFGYTEFRKGQLQLIDAVLSGRDALGIMPTGAGKSLCYQVPAMLVSGVTVVISPLISLMKDQVSALNQCNIPSVCINTSMTADEIGDAVKEILRGRVKLVYVAPERLMTPFFLSVCSKIKVDIIAVDEAHCVSQWGQDFRPSYLEVRDFIKTFPERPAVCAFTATATPRVREDIERLLELENPERLVTSFDRENLYFEALKPKDKRIALKRYLDLYTGKSGIVYCSSRKCVDELYEYLLSEGYSVTKYHAGMSKSERVRNQELFSYDEREIIIATNAFGMGIDKSNVGFVIHYNMPGDLESYYQEAGRAGRDGRNADCILFYGGNDVRIQQFFINNPEDNPELSEKDKRNLRQLRLEKLSSMLAYCEGEICLRKYILSYFGQKSENCGNCSVCTGLTSSIDVTEPAQKIFSCIVRLKGKETKRTVCDVLKGKLTEDIEKRELDKIKTFGAMSDTAESIIEEHIDYFIERGYIKADEKNRLTLFEKSKAVLFEGRQLRRLRQRTAEKSEGHRTDVMLLIKLKKLRSQCAKKASVPDFIVFTDATLISIAKIKPRTLDRFAKIPGVSLSKLEKYGVIFIREINKHCKENIEKRKNN
ncbi:MAG: DNA helicase RecQ [Clostridia bacterium]|nr:DNA helicase RecQ [Clostridia bacterium]